MSFASSVFLVALLASSCALIINAQAETMIPLSKDGHAFHRGNTSASTVVEFFIDLACSACMDEWPTLTEVYNAYKDKVHFEYRLFPLPYHQQGRLLSC
jgi:protein-disulfide isomerase